MEIKNISSALNVYKKMNTGYRKSSVTTEASSARNVDRAEFSAAAGFAEELAAAKKESAASVNADASPERISALKEQLANGTYSVSPESIAAAIIQ